ncbi:MAG: hypothetical protein CW338_08455 [Clostridiales bacterium]|nr:hypothetical protein [Clostridiales bacterium]
MKKFSALLLALLMLVCCICAAEGETWFCPVCGTEAEGNFCSGCGAKRPDDGSWICPVCGSGCTTNFCSNCGTKRPEEQPQAAAAAEENSGLIRLDLSIAFEKNTYFATYDVDLFVDDVQITVMRHGVDFAGTIYVTPGKHVIRFRESGVPYSSQGATVINMSEPSRYECTIQTEVFKVKISSERTVIITDDQENPDGKPVFRLNGDLMLKVKLEFKKNGIFSRYDVDMYLDDMLVTTLAHGKNFEGTLLVSQGTHIITFCKAGDTDIQGTISFKVDKDAFFSCRIEAEWNKVTIKNDKLSY